MPLVIWHVNTTTSFYLPTYSGRVSVILLRCNPEPLLYFSIRLWWVAPIFHLMGLFVLSLIFIIIVLSTPCISIAILVTNSIIFLYKSICFILSAFVFPMASFPYYNSTASFIFVSQCPLLHTFTLQPVLLASSLSSSVLFSLWLQSPTSPVGFNFVFKCPFFSMAPIASQSWIFVSKCPLLHGFNLQLQSY